MSYLGPAIRALKIRREFSNRFYRNPPIDSEGGIIYNTTMGLNIVLDTNVIVAGLRSTEGASYRLLKLLGDKRFTTCLSVPLMAEYESVLKRKGLLQNIAESEIDDFLDYMAAIAYHQKVFYLWRPILRDPKDDMILELAVAAQCKYIITFNVDDFKATELFNIKVIKPNQFLRLIKEPPTRSTL